MRWGCAFHCLCYLKNRRDGKMLEVRLCTPPSAAHDDSSADAAEFATTGRPFHCLCHLTNCRDRQFLKVHLCFRTPGGHDPSSAAPPKFATKGRTVHFLPHLKNCHDGQFVKVRLCFQTPSGRSHKISNRPISRPSSAAHDLPSAESRSPGPNRVIYIFCVLSKIGAVTKFQTDRLVHRHPPLMTHHPPQAAVHLLIE